MQVRRRLVIYVQGYDPRGLAEYYRMFRRNFRRTCELYGLTGKVGTPKEDPNRFVTSWDITTNGADWQVETRFLFLRWEDIIRKDFERPPWWKLLHMVLTTGQAIGNGVVWRILKAHWRFGLFILYPLVLTIIWLLFGGGVGALAMYFAGSLGAPAWVDWTAGVVCAIGAFVALILLTEPQTYLLYLCDDTVSTVQFAHRKRRDWEQRMEVFAGYVADELRDSDADEAVIVGHSSGSFLAVDVLDRALKRDPHLGEHRPRVRLLTLGANLPIVGFHPSAQWFRNQLRRLAVSRAVDWVDYQSRHDVMNFWPFDPVTGHGLVPDEKERRNPIVVAISFRDLWKSEAGRRRWRFFQAHFQFLLANERLGAAYDYYLICCGPLDLMTRATEPAVAIAAIPANTGPEPGATATG